MEITGRKYRADGFESFSMHLNDPQEHELAQLAQTYAARMGNEVPTDEDFVAAANALHGHRGCKPNMMHGDVVIDAVER